MIVQCDQCSAKYKLDDNKVTESGVKIRCKRCQHIFPVKKKLPQEKPAREESLFDLQGSVAEQATPPQEPSATPEPEAHEPSGTEEIPPPFFLPEEEPASTPTKDSSSIPQDSVEFTLPSELPAPSPATDAADDDFSFAFEPAAPVSLPSVNQEERRTSPGEVFPAPPQPDDVLEFSFTNESLRNETVVPPPPSTITEEPSKSSGKAPRVVKSVKVAPKREPWVPELDDINSVDFDTLVNGLPPEPIPPIALPSSRREAVPEDDGAVSAPESYTETDEEAPSDLAQDQESDGASAVIDDESPPSEEQTSDESVWSELPPPDDVVTTDPSDNVEDDTPVQTSRRQGPSPLAILGIFLGGLLLLFVGGVGALYLLEGPEALRKIGLGSLARLLNADDKIQERVLVKNLEGSYVNTREGKELFVLKGEALNLYPTPHAAIQVRGLIYNSAGTVILQKTTYCGNPLTSEQLATLPLAKIEEAMNNKLGASYANIGVPPGKTVPFVIVFPGLPKDAVDFGVEVAASQPVGELIIIK